MRSLRLLLLSVFMGVVVCGCGNGGAEDGRTEKKSGEQKAENGKESAMGLSLKWLGHASFRITDENTVIYIDPWKLKDQPGDGNLVLVSHSHADHYSPEDVNKVSAPGAVLIAPNDVIGKACGGGQAIMPGLTVEFGGVVVKGVAAYNPNKQFHPKANQWVGFIIEIGGKRIYYAGDTDITDEMKAVHNIDVALLPVGGKYTMNAEEAAEAVGYIEPKLAVPYHWGDIIGSEADAESFADKAGCEVKVLKPGEFISL
ncbi:MAG: MBL fold metallo-hydrolase [Sedimentisphaerales bacterium]|nr:MBL fold metallo-hydrolase [Sedimentisphaerales bacterium]